MWCIASMLHTATTTVVDSGTLIAAMTEASTITFDSDGLIPAVVQDARSGEVLLLAWMNREALGRTLESGSVTFWSRSRGELWVKGATSGNTLTLVSVQINCEGNSLLVLAHPAGPTCHTGNISCFYRELDPPVHLAGI